VSADVYDYEIFNTTKLSDLSIEDIKSNEQVLQDVVKMVEFLPDVQQEVVRMRFFEDLSFKEIADKTGVSINTALGRMRYALLNMRKMAQEKDVYLEIK
jgi:RNA polymerase sigma-70 factor (ECF subfamily)